MIIGILGILKAGAAYVPIDPEYPEERISCLLKDTGAAIVLSSKAVQSRLPAIHHLEIIALDQEYQPEGSILSNNLQIRIEPHHLAYVIYTSGTTGEPKGVMNEHRDIMNRLCWAQEYFRLTGHDAILQKTTFSFDVSVWELLWPLLAGARLVIAKPEGHKDIKYLKCIIERRKITVLHFVPSMLAIFLPELQPGECKELRKVLCSGEALKPVQLELFKQKLPAVELHNLYGPTEAAIDVTCWSAEKNDEDCRVVPIGRPVSNTAIYILNECHALVPLGGIGELYIGGVQVARGYLNRPELTSASFIANPFSEAPGARMYKTGDLGRWLPDGNIEYLGRTDDQVKIRGYRIEPGEIENVLQQGGLVNQAVVLAREDETGNQLLAAYVVADGLFDKAAAGAYLKSRLPEYMVPAVWLQLESLPLTASGKTDRKALRDINGSGFSSAQGFVGARNEVEASIAGIWQSLLGKASIGIYDNFF